MMKDESAINALWGIKPSGLRPEGFNVSVCINGRFIIAFLIKCYNRQLHVLCNRSTQCLNGPLAQLTLSRVAAWACTCRWPDDPAGPRQPGPVYGPVGLRGLRGGRPGCHAAQGGQRGSHLHGHCWGNHGSSMVAIDDSYCDDSRRDTSHNHLKQWPDACVRP